MGRGSTVLATACQHSNYFSFIFNYFSEYFSESGVWCGVDDCHPEHRGTIYRSSVQPGGVWAVWGDLSDFGNCQETIKMIRIFTNQPFNFTSFEMFCLLLFWIQMVCSRNKAILSAPFTVTLQWSKKWIFHILTKNFISNWFFNSLLSKLAKN